MILGFLNSETSESLENRDNDNDLPEGNWMILWLVGIIGSSKESLI